MSPKCVVMKARKAPVSQIFNIPGNGCLKNLPSKALRSQIIEFLIEIKSWGAIEDVTAERKEGGAQELLEQCWSSGRQPHLALPVSKREKPPELTDNINKMRPKCITLKAKKTPISKTFNVTKVVRQAVGNLKASSNHEEQGQSSGSSHAKGHFLSHAASTGTMKVHNRTKVETDMPGKTRFHPELQRQGHWPDGGGAPCPHSRAVEGKGQEGTQRPRWRSNASEFPAPHFQCSPY